MSSLRRQGRRRHRRAPAARARRRRAPWRPRARRSIATDVLDFERFDAEGAGWDGPIVERHLDVTATQSDWAELAAWLAAEHGRVDALVNNAGVAARERLPERLARPWQQTFDINVTGPMLGIQALVPLMPAGSSIVNICSVAAMAGHAAAAYTSSKWALRGLTRTASLELGATRASGSTR